MGNQIRLELQSKKAKSGWIKGANEKDTYLPITLSPL